MKEAIYNPFLIYAKMVKKVLTTRAVLCWLSLKATIRVVFGILWAALGYKCDAVIRNLARLKNRVCHHNKSHVRVCAMRL